MKDRNISYLWPLDPIPAGSGVWFKMIGLLVGSESSHYHTISDFFCPHVVESGTGTVEANGRTYQVKRGDMFTLWPGVEIRYYTDPRDPWVFRYIHLTGEKPSAFMKACGFNSKHICFKARDPEKAITCMRRVFELTKEKKTFGEFDILSLLFSYPKYCQPEMESDHQEDCLSQATIAIDAMLSKGININELCDVLNTSRASLFRLFKKNLNMTPIQYLDQKRIKRSKQLLRETNFSLSMIARQSGFNSEKYFMRKFKQQTGLTPSEFRLSR